MEEAEGLAYDDPQSDYDATVMGADSSQGPQLSLHYGPTDSLPNTPRSSAPHLPGSPMEHLLLLEPAVMDGDTVEVHVDEEELADL